MKNRLRIPGILGGILFAVGIVGFFSIPGGGKGVTDEQLLAFYNSSGKRTAALIGYLALIVSCWLLVWLFNELRAALAMGTRTVMAHQLGVMGAVLVMVGGGINLAPALDQMITGRAYVGPDIASALAVAGLGVLTVGVWTMAVSIFLISLQIRSSGVSSRWLWIFGMVIAVLLADAFPATILLVAIWAIVVGITGVRAEEHN
jgi:hypothetical protein